MSGCRLEILKFCVVEDPSILGCVALSYPRQENSVCNALTGVHKSRALWYHGEYIYVPWGLIFMSLYYGICLL